MKRILLGLLATMAYHTPTFAIGHIAWDAEASLAQYSLDDSLNGLTKIDNSAIQVEGGASYRLPSNNWVLNLDLSPMSAELKNNGIHRSASESTTGISARISYNYRGHKLSLAYSQHDYDSISETLTELRVQQPF